jgi:hypothetical protein
MENLVYFMAIRNILWPNGIFYGHLVILMSFGIFFARFGTLHQEKSGNPAPRDASDGLRTDFASSNL